MISGIKLCRLKAGLETHEAVEQLGIKKGTLYKIEQGCLHPSIKLLDRMRKVYNCSADDILNGLNIQDSLKIPEYSN
jgi:putative transcriptional regulator